MIIPGIMISVFVVLIVYAIVMTIKCAKASNVEYYTAVMTDCYMEGNEFICMGTIVGDTEGSKIRLYDVESAEVGMKIQVKKSEDGRWTLYKDTSQTFSYVYLLIIAVIGLAGLVEMFY